MTREKAKEFLELNGYPNPESNFENELIDTMVQFASQGEKEEVETGWVIINEIGKTLWETFEPTESSAKENYIYWDDLEEQGYKCVQAERITRLNKTTEG